jgi:hypothetical protein
MATVGNLFVNIKGNTRGLDVSLKQAKSKLSKFQQFAGGFAAIRKHREARSKLDVMLAQRRDIASRLYKGDASAFEQAPGIGAAIRKQRPAIAAAGKAADAARMGMFVGAAFATLGVTAAAAGYIIREASKVQKTTEQDFETFTAAGAMGRVRKLMDRIEYVQRPEVQREQADIQEMERYQLRRERDVYGEEGAFFRGFGIDMRQMGTDIVGAVTGRNSTLTGGF